MTIPNSVTSIRQSAFLNCTNLKTVEIPNSAISIESGAFSNTALYNDESNWENGVLYIGNHLIKVKNNQVTGEYAIKDGTLTLAQLAFQYSSITSVEIPNSVKLIGDGAFSECTRLTTVTIPTSVTSIGNSAFHGCEDLSSLKIGNSVASIGNHAFERCGSLFSLEIPNSVKSIGWHAFEGCNNLRDLIVNISNPSNISLEDDVFYDIMINRTTLYVPAGSKELYAIADQWREFKIIEEFIPRIINIEDGQPYAVTSDIQDIDVTYTRNFGNTYWQGLYVPFDMSYEEWAPYAQVAELAGVHMYDDDNDGTPDRTNIEFATVKEGKILPNVPYVIKANETGEVTFECTDKVLTAAPSVNGYVSSCTPRWEYRLTGTYESRPDLISDGIYSLGSGKFRPNNAAIPPFRFYLQMLKRKGGYWGAPGVMDYPSEIEISIDGETVSGISSIFIDEEIDINDENYYDLNGRMISEPTNGIYIHKGKLMLINK